VSVLGGGVVVLGGDDDEGSLVALGGVLGLPLVLHVGVETLVVVRCVGHNLGAAVRELHLVASLHVASVALFVLAEVQTLVGVVHSVGEAVGLGGLLVVLGCVGVYGRAADCGQQTARSDQHAESSHLELVFVEW